MGLDAFSERSRPGAASGKSVVLVSSQIAGRQWQAYVSVVRMPLVRSGLLIRKVYAERSGADNCVDLLRAKPSALRRSALTGLQLPK